ncbi:unnamed protein product [Brassica oleracea]|uniref:(rape) hypothetical protein n=1 Tax=Brassica napus TaxID=3708 RepID=A0A816KX93_BRANA|nr:unnamed protein product [Brassica napus]
MSILIIVSVTMATRLPVPNLSIGSDHHLLPVLGFGTAGTVVAETDGPRRHQDRLAPHRHISVVVSRRSSIGGGFSRLGLISIRTLCHFQTSNSVESLSAWFDLDPANVPRQCLRGGAAAIFQNGKHDEGIRH